MNIIEYNDKFAQHVADMWNRSNSSWGNDDQLKTAKDVIASEASSGNIKLYLAIDNDEVVGYCSFSEYKQDTGASYLPLLNVRPDYHGKKVGKALILKVLEDAKVSKWPRFDLYTWSGNIKAMPLYKKCGFFWERKNDTVHLMNFIPYLYQTEALESYVNQIDWYKDSKRVIDMDQDGIELNGFDFYRYDFKNDQTHLSLEFERYGRGLTYIDTPDYEIRMNVPKHKLVFNETYEVTFDVVNKTNKPLDIKIKGINNKNIISDYEVSLYVEDTKTITKQFTVESTTEKQNKSKTHPCVEADVYIDGLNANFRCGILPKKPIEVDLVITDFIHNKNESYKAYLNLENNLDTKETFLIKLPSTLVAFKDEVEVTLDSKEKASIEVPYSVNEFGFYNEDVVVMYGKNTYKTNIKAPIIGSKESFTCDFEDEVFIVSGNYVAMYKKHSHNIMLIDRFGGSNHTSFMPAKLGLPYSLEFNNKKSNVDFISDNQIDVTFESDAFSGISLIAHIKHNHGLLEITYEILNNGEKRDISLSIPVWATISHSYLPYENSMLRIESEGGHVESIDTELLDGNWIYNHKEKHGFTWDKNLTMRLSDWHCSFDFENITLETKESYTTTPFYISFIHPNVKEFKKFANSNKELGQIEYMDINVNNGNPFIKGPVEASLNNRRKAQIKGTISNGTNKVDISEKLIINEGYNTFELDLEDRITSFSRYLFKPVGNVTTSEQNGVYVVDNGVLQFKADVNYSDSVYSLTFDNDEWLDSNHPTPKERSWWGDFVGGITQRCQGIQDISAIKEERTVEFVNIEDNHKNKWTGLKVSTFYKLDENLKGLTFESYIITQPGLPLIHTFTNVVNHSGKLLLNKGMHRFNTIQPSNKKENTRVKHKGITYKSNDAAVGLLMDKLLVMENDRNYKMAMYTRKNELIFDSEKDFIIVFSEDNITVPNKESKIFEGDFTFFTKEDIKKEDLVLFDSIKFEV